MATYPSKKRPREAEGIPESVGAGAATQNQESDPTKRLRSATSITSPDLPYIVVHRVKCSRLERYHEDHEPSADYFDVPRLLAQANKKTCLQGRCPIRDIESYLEDHHDFSFTVYITYSCTRYHEAIKDSSERIHMPVMGDNVAVQAKPFFYVLQHDARPATAQSEALILSEGLREALLVLRTEIPGFLSDWNVASNFAYPYLQLYYQRDLLVSSLTPRLKPSLVPHLKALASYLAERVSPEYADAEAMFDVGVVDRHHWAKLFRPGAVIVTLDGGQHVAHICKTSPKPSSNRLHVSCWCWAFDGSFFQRDVLLDIPWPSDSDTTALTDLSAYPLVYAKTGVENELRARGEVFWACRLRKFVNYDVPLGGMEVQIVMNTDLESVHIH